MFHLICNKTLKIYLNGYPTKLDACQCFSSNSRDYVEFLWTKKLKKESYIVMWVGCIISSGILLCVCYGGKKNNNKKNKELNSFETWSHKLLSGATQKSISWIVVLTSSSSLLLPLK